jgi:hypothetical protein
VILDPEERQAIFVVVDGAASVECVVRVHDPPHEVAADRRSLRINGEDGAMPFAFTLTADGWVEQLCRFTDRPFAAEERLLLPGGVDVEPPCPWP